MMTKANLNTKIVLLLSDVEKHELIGQTHTHFRQTQVIDGEIELDEQIAAVLMDVLGITRDEFFDSFDCLEVAQWAEKRLLNSH